MVLLLLPFCNFSLLFKPWDQFLDIKGHFRGEQILRTNKTWKLVTIYIVLKWGMKPTMTLLNNVVFNVH